MTRNEWQDCETGDELRQDYFRPGIHPKLGSSLWAETSRNFRFERVAVGKPWVRVI